MRMWRKSIPTTMKRSSQIKKKKNQSSKNLANTLNMMKGRVWCQKIHPRSIIPMPTKLQMRKRRKKKISILRWCRRSRKMLWMSRISFKNALKSLTSPRMNLARKWKPSSRLSKSQPESHWSYLTTIANLRTSCYGSSHHMRYTRLLRSMKMNKMCSINSKNSKKCRKAQWHVANWRSINLLMMWLLIRSRWQI